MKLNGSQIGFYSTFIAIMTALIVVGSVISFTVPVSNVPITLQTLFVLLAGLVFGPWVGSLSIVFYVLLGVIGLPVFAGGASGFGVLLGPTGGYIVGFVLAPIVIGLNSSLGKGKTVFVQILLDSLGTLVASILIYLIGTPVLMAVLDWDLQRALEGGVIPFIPFDLIKLVIAVALAPVGRKAYDLAKAKFGIDQEK